MTRFNINLYRRFIPMSLIALIIVTILAIFNTIIAMINAIYISCTMPIFYSINQFN